jgi:hypothetical protein
MRMFPIFCFSCGRIGHATLSYEEEPNEDHGVSFGEELRASPPKQDRDISVKLMASRVARLLFQVPDMSGSYRSGLPKGQHGSTHLRVDQNKAGQTGQGSMEGQKDPANYNGKKVLSS